MKLFDDRQLVNRAILQELMPWLPSQSLDVLMASTNADLTPPMKVDASSTPDLIVHVGPAIVVNPESNRNKSVAFIGTVVPTFTSGTVTFPAANGGTITSSTGQTYILNLPSGDYAQQLLSLDPAGNLLVVVGAPSSTLASAVVPTPSTNTLPFAYVTLHNIGGVVQNVTQSSIFQFVTGGGSSGGAVGAEVPLTIGTTSSAITFPIAQSTGSYLVLTQVINTVDVNPQYIPVDVINKTTTGFTVSWNDPLPTANYSLDYIISPGITTLTAQVSITATAAGTTNLTNASNQIQVFTGISSQTIVLPDGTTMPVGQQFEIYNQSTAVLTLEFFGGVPFTDAGGTSYTSIPPESSIFLVLQTNTTSQGTWAVLSPTGSVGPIVSVPTGAVMDFAGSSAPSGFLLCDGSAVSRTTFAGLFATVGTTYGSGNGTTTFNVPDARGRVFAGKDDMGGTPANRLTTGGSGISGITLGAAGGVETYSLVTAELASHTHTGTTNIESNTHTHPIPQQAGAQAGSGAGGGLGTGSFITSGGESTTHTHTFTTNSTGSGDAHQNTQPTIVFNKIIKT